MPDESANIKRVPGRPPRPEQEIRELVISSALWILLHQGYAATTMEAVAKHAGLAKKTLYKFSSNREELVRMVLRDWTDSFAPAMAIELSGPNEVQEALINILTTISCKVLSSDAVALFRLLGTDFPLRDTMLDLYNRNGIQRGTKMLTDWLEYQQSAGMLKVTDAEMVCSLLLSMVIGEPLRQMSLGIIQPVPDWDPRPRIYAAVQLASGRSLFLL